MGDERVARTRHIAGADAAEYPCVEVGGVAWLRGG